MNLSEWLARRGVPKGAVTELLIYIPQKMDERPVDDFCDAATIMNPDKWFYWPRQKRFVIVGQCPNGDGVAIDTKVAPGGIFLVDHELVNRGFPVDEMVIQVADSPSDYVRKRSAKDFPWDFHEAKEKQTKISAKPERVRTAHKREAKKGGRSRLE